MAFNFHSFFGLLIVVSTAVVVGVARGSDGLADDKNMTHVHFYFHEFYEGSPSPTSYLVSSLHNNSTTFFGDIRVFDNALREGPEVSSKLIGRAQGMLVDDSLGIRASLTMINFVFSDGEYGNSSLAMYGKSDMALSARAIIGGTDQFRLARGYALNKILSYNSTYLLLEYDIYLLLAN